MATPRLKGQWPTIMPSSAFHPTRTDPRSRPPTATSPAATTRTSGATGRRWPRSTRRGASSGGTNRARRTTPPDGLRRQPAGHGSTPPPAPTGPISAAAARRGVDPRGRTLAFGRYADWTISELAAHDPDYLEWLARAPAGLTFRKEIYTELARRPAAVLRPDGHGDAAGTVPIEVRSPPPLVAEPGSQPKGPVLRPARESSSSFRNRRSRVSSRFALDTQCVMARRYDGGCTCQKAQAAASASKRRCWSSLKRGRRPLVRVDRRSLLGPRFEGLPSGRAHASLVGQLLGTLRVDGTPDASLAAGREALGVTLLVEAVAHPVDPADAQRLVDGLRPRDRRPAGGLAVVADPQLVGPAWCSSNHARSSSGLAKKMTSCGVGAGLTAGPLSPRPSPRPRGAAPRRARRGAIASAGCRSRRGS